MKTSQKGINFIKTRESCELRAYKDAVGVLTIGYGHTGPDVKESMVITPERAEELLQKDLERFEKCVTGAVKVALKQQQFDALVSFSYNVGEGAFRGSTLLKLVNMNPDDPLIRSQFLRWNKGTVKGKQIELRGLTIRRGKEADMYFS